MQVAQCEAPWVRAVKSGDLNLAYLEYRKAHRTRWIRDSRPTQWLTTWILAPLAAKLLPALPLASRDTDIDLSEEYLLFWKHPNQVGFRLVLKITGYIVLRRQVPTRAAAWLAHWMLFQGRNGTARKIFSRLRPPRSELNHRLRGELFSLLGNMHFNVGSYARADRWHQRAQTSLARSGDRFFQMFNLGLWIRISGQSGDIRHLERILSHFDSLNFKAPDERYGLRLLTYGAYLHSCDGNEALSRQFYHSAERAFQTSGSELDKCLFRLMDALVLRREGKIAEGEAAILAARKHLNEYGNYQYLSDIIDLVISQFRLERRLRSTGKKTTAGAKEPAQEAVAFERDWYRNFFELSLTLHETFEATDFQSVMQEFAARISAVDLQLAAVPPSEFIALVTQENSGGTDFAFSLYHRAQNYRVIFRVPFQKWRNQEMITAITTLILSLQTLGARQRDKEVQIQIKNIDDQRELARQIGHDIRSPLTALAIATEGVTGMPPDRKRLLDMSISRIQSIADRLLKRPTEANVETALISQLMERVVAEARIRFSARHAIHLTSQCGSTPVFARVDPTEFERALSNLINNAVEALATEGGSVLVSLDATDRQARIRVTDTGVGIPTEIREQVGQRGFSYGKKGGSGLGLSHARSSFEAWNGSLEIQSEPGRGTEVTLRLPVAPTPDWFVQTLSVEPEVVVLDDDPSIHEIWKQRLAESNMANQITLRSFSNGESLQQWLKGDSRAPKVFTLLADYDLGDSFENGLDIIEKLGLAQKSYLVSSAAGNPKVLARCRQLGIGVLSKDRISAVPISV